MSAFRRATATRASSGSEGWSKAEQHPNAERLRVCKVQLAGADVRTIVCGAPNVAAGEVVLVALPGAVLANGTKMGIAELRGVRSEGMIISETEVELGTDSEGIVVLPDSYEIGEAAETYLTLGDDVLELEINPNRPDCLSRLRRGARAARAHRRSARPEPGDGGRPEQRDGKAEDHLSVTVDDLELCPRFSVRVFTDVKIGPSPLWLKARLVAAGQRPINNVVDITNYVMLALGQPMHAYDLDRLAGPALHVRRAREGERLRRSTAPSRCSTTTPCSSATRRPRRASAGSWAAQRARCPRRRRRVAMEAATWNGRQHPRDLEEAGPADRGERAFREAAPSGARAARAGPCGAR